MTTNIDRLSHVAEELSTMVDGFEVDASAVANAHASSAPNASGDANDSATASTDGGRRLLHD